MRNDYIIFVATSWGTAHGGINSFNFDMCKAIGMRRKDSNEYTYCVVLDAISDMDKRKALKSFNVNLVCAFCENYEVHENDMELPDFLGGLDETINFDESDSVLWIGHDIKTGNFANLCRNKFGGKSLVICHMNLSEYYYLATQDVSKNREKVKLQKKVFKEADFVGAVGPYLDDFVNDIRNDDDNESIVIIPGMLDVSPRKKANVYMHKLLFLGRLEKKNNYIKQPILAVAAFAKAYQDDRDIFTNNPEMNIVGYTDDPSKEEQDYLKSLVSKYSSETLKVLPQKYIDTRDELSEMLRNSTICIMVSRHEGFGLAAYEAISAGVPIIISDNTGLHKFLSHKNGTNVNSLYTVVHVEGRADKDGLPSSKDLEEVSKAIRNVVIGYSDYKKNALKLRDILIEEGYNWDNQAGVFLNDIKKKLIESGDEEKNSLVSSVELWGNASYKVDDIRKYMERFFLPNFCRDILELKEDDDFKKYVRCVTVKFDKENDIRGTVAVAGNTNAELHYDQRKLDDGVVGAMQKINKEIALVNGFDDVYDMWTRPAAIFYDFSKDECLMYHNNDIHVVDIDGMAGVQSKQQRAILAFPLLYLREIVGAVTLDFYNPGILHLNEGTEIVSNIMRAGTKYMDMLSAYLFKDYTEVSRMYSKRVLVSFSGKCKLGCKHCFAIEQEPDVEKNDIDSVVKSIEKEEFDVIYVSHNRENFLNANDGIELCKQLYKKYKKSIVVISRMILSEKDVDKIVRLNEEMKKEGKELFWMESVCALNSASITEDLKCIPSPNDRIDFLGTLNKKGIHTILAIRPLFPSSVVPASEINGLVRRAKGKVDAITSGGIILTESIKARLSIDTSNWERLKYNTSDYLVGAVNDAEYIDVSNELDNLVKQCLKNRIPLFEHSMMAINAISDSKASKAM